ncbi:putative rRNA methyltransferase [Gordonia rhizosphera NBRC 16068]|uniref:Putative rRNA methyltransferase n=1 Tax=Gordonia rhizosphera NBRC 16068 TaxID=1108045 RepID=K6WFX3_9ACTN|nr:putative rRNA methyltransferase [Gordonia rhizosphera NBRC 16068]
MSLFDGRSTPHRSDTAAMVTARRRVHASGLFDSVAGIVAGIVEHALTPAAPGVVFDAGAGTGHYLAATLDRVDSARGIGVDLSKYCARAIARSHPRAAAVVADLWRPLPIASGSVGAILSIFSPRNVTEFARVLDPAGVLVVVTPNPDHLTEIIEPMGMLAVGADKDERLAATLAEDFETVGEQVLREQHMLGRDAITDLVAMGPSAFHRSADEIAADADALTGGGTEDIAVSLSISVTTATPRRS